MITSILRLFNTLLLSSGFRPEDQVRITDGVYSATVVDSLGYRYQVTIVPVGRLQVNLDAKDLDFYDSQIGRRTC